MAVEDYYFRNILIQPNFEKDNYLIHFITKVDTFSLEAYPNYWTNNPDVDMKRNKKVFQNYREDLEKRQGEWVRLEAIYTEKEMEFQVKMASPEVQEILARVSPTYLSRPRFAIQTFGVCNIDRLMKRIDEVLKFWLKIRWAKK